MKSFFVCLLASFCACVSFAGEPTPAEPQSVLKVEAPATVVALPPGLLCVSGKCGCGSDQCGCVSGRCGTSRLYSVQSEQQEHCRNRLFGGHVVRKTQRTVVKPVRR
jgi:hypothetical protein